MYKKGNNDMSEIQAKEVIRVEELRLNELWLEFLENNTLWFLLKEIPEEIIEKLKTANFMKMSKYMNNLDAEEGDVLHWDIRLTFAYKGEWICLYRPETDPEWECCDESYTSKGSAELIEEFEEVFSDETIDVVLNHFLKVVLNEEYKLNI